MTVKLLTITLMFLTFAAMAAGNVRPENPVVLVETSMGNFKVELLEDKAPITVKNFLAYADEKFYDGTVFHRILGKPANTKDFMIQGGGFEPGGKQKKTKDPIKNEANNGLSNTRGTLAMARTGIVDSATSQFFINLTDNTFLDHAGADPRRFGYCVFGRVIEGMDVVDKIKSVDVEPNEMGELAKPKKDVIIKSITRVKK
jgi:cyclophilin family peptidyl-prolyl cis-trans isomerase